MPVDNDLYERTASTWWDDDNPLSLLRTALNPARVGYFTEVLVRRAGRDPGGTRALDVGCGGGFLTEELARLGCRVTGVDPSPGSVAAARAHAASAGLDIDYRVSFGEALPFSDASFDVVTCCDVLEHVEDLGAVLTETARVLRPGGLWFFDTINRTWLSRLLAIKAMQEWRATRFFATELHDWEMFIRPDELRRACTVNRLAVGEVVGLRLRGPVRMLVPLVALKRGRISYAEFGRRVEGAAARDTRVSYMGYAARVPGP